MQFLSVSFSPIVNSTNVPTQQRTTTILHLYFFRAEINEIA